jgi:hypothetical protein
MKFRVWIVIVGLLGLIGASGCNGTQTPPIRVRVKVDGKELVLSASETMSVRQLLQRENITTGDLDRINPNDFAPIVDGMVITIVRVENRSVCDTDVLAYAIETMKTDTLSPGVSRVLQAGVNGTVRVCYDVVYEDGAEKSRVQSSRTVLTPPTNQIVAVGVDSSKIEPVTVAGFLAYISSGQARYMENNSLNQGVLPTGGVLDGAVFTLSDDSRQLLYTRKPADPTKSPDTYNELWVLLDTSDVNAQPVRLIIDNVLTASWVPGEPFTFSYSTLQSRAEPPGYQALNDLFIARLDSKTGKILQAQPIVRSGPTGVYGLWGTVFEWSPDGKRLAWAQADGVGLVDQKAGVLRKVFEFKVYSTTLSNRWLWKPSLAWSPDSLYLTSTLHGKPLGSETEETSPVFDVAVAKAAGQFTIDPMKGKAGMWAAPRYSPLSSDGQGYLGFLQARTPLDSVSGEYDLVLADRDGSNARILFPGVGKAGIRPLDDGSEFAWSPDGRQIALIYQGNIYIVDVDSGHATGVTIVGNAQHPRWIR